MFIFLFLVFFFFQAEDGIRDTSVTGVQTCALPISRADRGRPRSSRRSAPRSARARGQIWERARERSEERRVGKECRSRGSRYREERKRHHREGGEVEAEYGQRGRESK